MRRALALAKAALAVAGCGGLVLLYLLAGPFAGPHGGSSGLGPSPHGAVQWSAAHGVQRVQQQLLAYLRRPLENITLDTGLPPPGYLVYNPSCRIPDTDPYHPSLEKLVKREDPVVCSTLPPLTSTRLIPVDNRQGALGSLAMYVLRLDVDLLPKYKPRFFHNVTCCYQSITRVDPKPESKADDKDVDNKFHMGRCEDLVREAQLDPEVEFVIVRCAASRIGGVNKTVYTNVHAVVAPKASVRAKLREYPPRGPDDPRLSVLVIGVDSVSRLNYFRTMPRTADLLRSHGWYELRGYNKIEDNTFPNLMAILTGMTRPQVEKTCFKTSMTPMDDCPFIWRNFSRAGYVTAYVEDEPTIGTFNYKKAGFAHAPTDYYLRPFLLAAQEHLKVRQQNHLNVCLGPSTAAEHILAFASSMASLLKDRLYFALFWMNSFSHNSVNSPSAMDDRMYYFWRDLLRSGALRNTLVLFLSDHGMRFGKIRETEIGWLEERLPFINVWLPESFRARYPSLDRGLRANEDRLTTPWDLHVTLRDVLAAPWGRVENTTAPEGAPSSSDSLTGCLACPRCSSLLQPVSANRGCADVAIEPHWCTCTEYRFMSTEDHTSRGAAQYVVDVIDAKMADNADAALSANWHCAPRTLKRVMSVRGRELENLDNVHRQDFIVILEASPGHAVFEATVRVSRNTSVSANMGDKQRVQHDLLGSISRINEFWEHSQCIHNADLKKYCHCTKGALPQILGGRALWRAPKAVRMRDGKLKKKKERRKSHQCRFSAFTWSQQPRSLLP